MIFSLIGCGMLGFNGIVLDRSRSYLTSRKSQIRIWKVKLDSEEWGIPLGSVLGPYYFLSTYKVSHNYCRIVKLFIDYMTLEWQYLDHFPMHSPFCTFSMLRHPCYYNFPERKVEFLSMQFSIFLKVDLDYVGDSNSFSLSCKKYSRRFRSDSDPESWQAILTSPKKLVYVHCAILGTSISCVGWSTILHKNGHEHVWE